MSLRFLCARHHKALSKSPVQALNNWEKWMKVGSNAYNGGNWLDAMRHLGCAFEVAGLLLKHPETASPIHPDTATQDMRHIDRYMIAGHYLASCFKQLGKTEMERHCLMAVHHRILHEYGNDKYPLDSLKYNLEISQHMLREHFPERWISQANGQFSGSSSWQGLALH